MDSAKARRTRPASASSEDATAPDAAIGTTTMSFEENSTARVSGERCAARRQHVLFVCGPGRMRSLTAEQVFATRPDLHVAAAGINSRAEHAVNADLVRWADVIFVMEEVQRKRLTELFGELVRGKHLVLLDIPDRYEYMDPQLIRLLKTKATRHLD
jgi:predicted protein tyrosine phosphatase